MTRVVVDGIARDFNTPTTRIRTLDHPVETGRDPLALPIGEATERGDSGLLDWFSLLQADDPEDTVRMDLMELPR